MNNSFIDLLSLYQIIDNSLIESEGEITPEIQALLDNFNCDLKDSLDRYRGWINYNRSQYNMYEEEENRLKARKLSCESRIEFARNKMLQLMELSGESKLKTDLGNYNIRNTESWELKEDITEENKNSLLSSGYATKEFKPHISIIKKDFKDGVLETIPDCIKITPKKSLIIR
jgi:hypothetical protein